jgi:hypothetical protein
MRFCYPPAIHLPDIVLQRSCLFSVFHLQAKTLYCTPVLKYIQIWVVVAHANPKVNVITVGSKSHGFPCTKH